MTLKKANTMKTLPLYVLLIILTGSCFNEDDYYVKTTEIVPITEVSIPDSSAMNDTIQIMATAEANNGCWGDLHFRLDSVDSQDYVLQAIGTFESRGTCPTRIVTADTTIELIATLKGKYYFHIALDSYTLQTDSVVVE